MRYGDELYADFPGICVRKIDRHAVAVVYSDTVLRDKHYPVVDRIHLDSLAPVDLHTRCELPFQVPYCFLY
jgi:hypothetical protein